MCLSSSTIWGYWHHAAIGQTSQANAIQGWVQPSSTQIPQEISYIYDGGAQVLKIPWKLNRLMSHCVESILSYVKKGIWSSKVLFDGCPGGPSTEDNSHLRWKKSSGNNSSFLKEANYVHCLKRISSPSKGTNGSTFLLGDRMVTPTLGQIRSLPKSI